MPGLAERAHREDKIYPLLIGTYTTQRDARGVYLAHWQRERGLTIVDCVPLRDPSFVVMHPKLPVAYAVNETPDDPGGVSVIAVDRRAERAHLVQQVPAAGHLPCHLALTDAGERLAVAHYGCGSFASWQVSADGRLTGAPVHVQHRGQSLHARRQSSAHAHFVAVHPRCRLYVTDLGMDAVVTYENSADLSDGVEYAVTPGSGPRHLCFSANGQLAYLVNELSNMLMTFRIDGDGELRLLHSVSTLPPGFVGKSALSEVALHPSGRSLYVANRGHDSVACFALHDPLAPQLMSVVACGGKHPRHFALTPDGAYLLVANRDSDNLQAFQVDPESGALAALGAANPLPAPSCVCWIT